MMKRLMLYISVLATAATACTQQELPEKQTQKTIELHAQVECAAVAKSAADNNTALTAVQILRKDSTEIPKNFAEITPLDATRTTDGTIQWGTKQEYDLVDKNAYFIGYHPAGTLATNVVTWTIDGKTDILSSAVYDAGKYTNPKTNTMTFAHQLAQLEIVCQADPSATLAEIQKDWGKISAIELIETPTQLKYSCSANQINNGKTLGAIALRQKDYETAFVSTDIPASTNTTVTAAGMFAPQTGVIKVRIKTARQVNGLQIALSFGATENNFAQGKKYTATLLFKPSIKEAGIEITGTKITAWSTGYAGSTDVTK